jgi:ABC-type sulfate transport system substrate-binding protein
MIVCSYKDTSSGYEHHPQATAAPTQMAQGKRMRVREKFGGGSSQEGGVVVVVVGGPKKQV